MLITFPYNAIDPLEVPDEQLMGVYSPVEVSSEIDEEDLIRSSFDKPLGGVLLEDLLRETDRVLILVDDNTRLTPTAKILPVLIERLLRKLDSKKQIRLLVASGTHRPMTTAEKERKYGRDICREFQVFDHNWEDPKNLVSLGETPSGIPIQVNRMLTEADFVLGIGHIVPHRVAGFSGGGKIVQPGVCGTKTTDQTHWMSAKFRGDEITGKADNPIRREIDAVAKRVGLKFLVNAVQDGKGRLANLFVGAPELVFEEGTKLAREVFGVTIPHKADIVIIDSYPADLELWQASKGVYSAGLAVSDGGVVILVTPCSEGVATTHPEVAKYGYRSYQEVLSMVNSGELTDLTVAAHLVHVGEVIRDKATGIMVSPGIDRETTEHLGFKYAATPKEALAIALEQKGKSASIAVFHHGGECLPIIA